MKLKIPPKVEEKTFELCEKTNVTIAEVVIERKGLLDVMSDNRWSNSVVEKFHHRLNFLNAFIVDYFLAHYKVKK